MNNVAKYDPLIQEINELNKQITLCPVFDFELMALCYKKAKELYDMIDEDRKNTTEPLRQQTSLINEQYKKDMLSPLEAIIRCCNDKAISYVELLKKMQQEEQEAQKQAAIELGDEFLSYQPIVSLSLQATHATLTEKKTKKFKVIDPKKVPKLYLTVDEKKIQLAVEMGVSIEGVEVYEESTYTLRKK